MRQKSSKNIDWGAIAASFFLAVCLAGYLIATANLKLDILALFAVILFFATSLSRILGFVMAAYLLILPIVNRTAFHESVVNGFWFVLLLLYCIHLIRQTYAKPD